MTYHVNKAGEAPSAGRSKVFETGIEVTDEHVDAPGHHVNNVVYVQWIQQVAEAHWNAAAPEELRSSVVWYVLRHEIDYLKEAFVGDRLVARTYVGEARGARMERFVEILREDGTMVARARSVWAAINARTGRPTRITAEMCAPFVDQTAGPVGAVSAAKHARRPMSPPP